MYQRLVIFACLLALILSQVVASAAPLAEMTLEGLATPKAHCAAMAENVEQPDGSTSEPCSSACEAACAAPVLATLNKPRLTCGSRAALAAANPAALGSLANIVEQRPPIA
jgi:hypothetical protein